MEEKKSMFCNGVAIAHLLQLYISPNVCMYICNYIVYTYACMYIYISYIHTDTYIHIFIHRFNKHTFIFF